VWADEPGREAGRFELSGAQPRGKVGMEDAFQTYLPTALHALIDAAESDCGTEAPFYAALNAIRRYGDERVAAADLRNMDLRMQLARSGADVESVGLKIGDRVAGHASALMEYQAGMQYLISGLQYLAQALATLGDHGPNV